MTPTIAFVLGTRPEIIKLAPVVRECDARGIDYVLCHTGQHYSESLDGVFFDQLDLAEPEYNLETGSESHGRQTGEMLTGVERVLRTEAPDTTIVQGDTNSVLAGALAASKLETRLGHLEAGLRSFDRSMPEEINRIVADHVADHLYAPTAQAAAQLEREAIPDERIFTTGNTVVDAVEQHRPLADAKSTVHADLALQRDDYALLTVHRPANVDDPDRFAAILAGVGQAAVDLDLEVVYPVHPRARPALDTLDVPDSIRLTAPLDYLDFLALEDGAALAFTDSGGVQEEVCILGTPCVTVRDNTERPETLDAGANQLAGADPEAIRRVAHEMVGTAGWANPFGDGTAGEQVVTAALDQDARLEVSP
ncbi:non-hydrolyzing UDP-N-acetylglucosamine 2-epimerase [Halobacteriales archaeon Cl-PHB]